MNWLLFILRVLFGWPAAECSDAQRVAVRPDGSTVTLPADATTCRRQVGNWDWLLPHSLGRERKVSAHTVVDHLEHGQTRTNPGSDARQRIRESFSTNNGCAARG